MCHLSCFSFHYFPPHGEQSSALRVERELCAERGEQVAHLKGRMEEAERFSLRERKELQDDYERQIKGLIEQYYLYWKRIRF